MSGMYNLDGLLKVIKDGNTEFDETEQRAMLRTAEGRRLSVALQKCLGLRRQMLQTQQQEKEKQKLREKYHKYKDCLGYTSCPRQWMEYTECWTPLSHLGPQEVQERGGIEGKCRNELQLMERCVGGLVSAAVRSVHEDAFADFERDL